ncbi:antibiotic biosynthesis monooxygenase [Acidobacteriota bacterium]
MVYLIISMDILPEKNLEFEQAVQWLVRLEDEVKGKFRQLISREIGYPEKAFYIGEWDSRKNLDAHIQTDRFRALLGGMKFLGKINEAKIITPSKVEELRLSA